MAIGGLPRGLFPTVIDRLLVAVLVSGAQRLGRDPRSESSEGAAQGRSRHKEAPARRERHSSAWAAARVQHVKREMIGVADGGSVRGAHQVAMWPVILLTMIILIAACEQSRPPGFLTRVREDCANGDQWACDLLTSLSNAARARQ